MNRRALKWAVALVASGALHAGAALWLGPNSEDVAVAGGARAEIALLGNAFQDMVAAGTTGDAVEPVAMEAETVQPVDAEQVSEPVDDTTQPIEAEPAAETTADPVTLHPTEVTTTPANQSPVQPEAVTKPVEAVTEGVAIAAVQPTNVETQDNVAIAPSNSETVEPLEQPDVPVMPEAAPRPTPRPQQVATAKPPAPKKQVQEKTRKPAAKQQQRAGSGGKAAQDSRRGSADGQKQAQSAKSGDAGRTREAGNAAVSNYPGKVYAKLRRSLRYPSEARRKRIRGEVHVRFTVSRSGGVGSVRLARSSGSPILDKAALETVRRAAPFPAIPPAAGRSSWSFTVPLAFTR